MTLHFPQGNSDMKDEPDQQRTPTKCVVCEEGAQALSAAEVQEQMQSLSGWQLIDDGKKIQKDWEVKNFQAAIDFFNKVGEMADQQGHHPDLHLESYRNVSIAISTHAIGGLSQFDFALAAAIDKLPVRLRKKK